MLLTLDGALPRVTMELMRHSDMKLTTKTYTDAGMLPTGETVRNLPSLVDESPLKKGTEKWTNFLVPAGHLVSQPVTNENGGNDLENGLNTGFRHEGSPSVTVSQGLENGARCRVRTCDFLRVKQAVNIYNLL